MQEGGKQDRGSSRLADLDSRAAATASPPPAARRHTPVASPTSDVQLMPASRLPCSCPCSEEVEPAIFSVPVFKRPTQAPRHQSLCGPPQQQEGRPLVRSCASAGPSAAPPLTSLVVRLTHMPPPRWRHRSSLNPPRLTTGAPVQHTCQSYLRCGAEIAPVSERAVLKTAVNSALAQKDPRLTPSLPIRAGQLAAHLLSTATLLLRRSLHG